MMPTARQGMPPDAINIHATMIVLGDRGVAITGPAGAGKTMLALSLIGRRQAIGRFARLVGDDQLFVAARSGRLLAYAPQTIAGLAEICGFGPVPAASEPVAVVDCVLDLVDPQSVPRIAAGEVIELAGVALPVFHLPARNTASGVLVADAIVASLLRPNDQVPANR